MPTIGGSGPTTWVTSWRTNSAAIALNTLSGRIVMLAGPALAGLIAAAWGLKVCYAVDTVSFVASLYATARLLGGSIAPPIEEPLSPEYDYQVFVSHGAGKVNGATVTVK